MKSHSTYNTDDRRWNAVVGREHSADGCFYYAVMTTGIFCRPSCSSKLPNRENIEYFISSQDAQASGYRPCKKCKPTGITVKEEVKQKIIKACRIIENSNTVPKVIDLAKELELSPSYFHSHLQFEGTKGSIPLLTLQRQNRGSGYVRGVGKPRNTVFLPLDSLK
jgi:AraC family transcriptional regulator of adaptative response/methylated-DNA-[protein]-cysteine methyltransferase